MPLPKVSQIPQCIDRLLKRILNEGDNGLVYRMIARKGFDEPV
jgi:hypothetical protein